MNVETRNDFRLNFTTDRGNLMSLNIPRADTSASGADVSAAMQQIIDSGVVHTAARGEPMLRHSAELVIVGRRDFNLTP